MAPREKIVCDCGGELSRPLPKICPHCGDEIVAVRRRLWPVVLPVFIVGAMFASLAAFVWWLTSGQ